MELGVGRQYSPSQETGDCFTSFSPLPSPLSARTTPAYFVLFVKKTFFLQQNYTKKRSSLWVKLTDLPVLIGITL